MTDDEIKEFDSADRMIDFKNRHPEAFRNNAKMASGFVSLEADVAELENQGAIRVTSAGMRSDGTQDKRSVRNDLDALVRKIAETGKLIKKEEPDFDNQFKVMRGRMSSAQLLETARGFINLLTQDVSEKMSEYGRASATAANLTAKIETFEAARTQQNDGRGEGVAATAQTKATMKRLRTTRRATAQIGKNILEETGDAGLIAEWKSACKLPKDSPPKPPGTDEPENGSVNN